MNKSIALSEILGLGAVIAGHEAQDKKGLLQDLAKHAAAALGLEEHGLFDMLWEREKLGTTGVGQGIAIPHARVPGLESVQGFFAQMSTPIPFDSVDNQAVDIVFLLLAPEEAGADHLHALACVSRALREQTFCAKLRGARDQDSLMSLLRSVEAVQAA